MAQQQKRIGDVTLEGVRLMMRNFSGAPDRFNKDGGVRSTLVALDDRTAEAMAADGWNVKTLPARTEEDDDQAYIKVKISTAKGGRPRRYVLISESKGLVNLTVEELSILDWADIEKVDLVLSAYQYDVNGTVGVAAYLQSIYVTIRESKLEAKYGLGVGTPDAAPAPWEED